MTTKTSQQKLLEAHKALAKVETLTQEIMGDALRAGATDYDEAKKQLRQAWLSFYTVIEGAYSAANRGSKSILFVADNAPELREALRVVTEQRGELTC